MLHDFQNLYRLIALIIDQKERALFRQFTALNVAIAKKFFLIFIVNLSISFQFLPEEDLLLISLLEAAIPILYGYSLMMISIIPNFILVISYPFNIVWLVTLCQPLFL